MRWTPKPSVSSRPPDRPHPSPALRRPHLGRRAVPVPRVPHLAVVPHPRAMGPAPGLDPHRRGLWRLLGADLLRPRPSRGGQRRHRRHAAPGLRSSLRGSAAPSTPGSPTTPSPGRPRPGQPPRSHWQTPARRSRRGGGAGPEFPVADDVGLGLGNPAADYLSSAQPVPPHPPVSVSRRRWRPTRPASAPWCRLPGVTPALARRWVDERRRRGGFRDIDDLASALDLQPHEIVRLRPRLSFAAPGGGPNAASRGRGRGRVLDA